MRLFAIVRCLYIGTTDGRVLVFPLQFNPTTQQVTASYERERALGHGKKPVSEILVLDDVGVILTLCGTSFLLSFKSKITLGKLSTASKFAFTLTDFICM